MQGNKTHEQLVRNLERKPDYPDARRIEAEMDAAGQDATALPKHPDVRASDLPVSQHGMQQESRDHNKHNHSGQTGHKPQQHSRAEEKH